MLGNANSSVLLAMMSQVLHFGKRSFMEGGVEQKVATLQKHHLEVNAGVQASVGEALKQKGDRMGREKEFKIKPAGGEVRNQEQAWVTGEVGRGHQAVVL